MAATRGGRAFQGRGRVTYGASRTSDDPLLRYTRSQATEAYVSHQKRENVGPRGL